MKKSSRRHLIIILSAHRFTTQELARFYYGQLEFFSWTQQFNMQNYSYYNN